MHPPAISIRVCMWPATVMIAFGGVPAGILNAYEHVKATGIIKYNGCILIATHLDCKYKTLFTYKKLFELTNIRDNKKANLLVLLRFLFTTYA